MRSGIEKPGRPGRTYSGAIEPTTHRGVTVTQRIKTALHPVSDPTTAANVLGLLRDR
jgi:hypothetical protein